MKAIRIHQYGDASSLRLEEVPRLSIADDQILVRISDAGVNPIDWKIRQGYMKQVRPATFPMIVGQDFAGEVVELGKAVTQFAVSDRVFGFAQGTYAEYAAAPASTVAAIPNSIDFATAAALPTAGSTAHSYSRRGWWRWLICFSDRQESRRPRDRHRHWGRH
jgi:NADPH:quinone reductase-like Zn-dependent oxidoreductase